MIPHRRRTVTRSMESVHPEDSHALRRGLGRRPPFAFPYLHTILDLFGLSSEGLVVAGTALPAGVAVAGRSAMGTRLVGWSS